VPSTIAHMEAVPPMRSLPRVTADETVPFSETRDRGGTNGGPRGGTCGGDGGGGDGGGMLGNGALGGRTGGTGGGVSGGGVNGCGGGGKKGDRVGGLDGGIGGAIPVAAKKSTSKVPELSSTAGSLTVATTRSPTISSELNLPVNVTDFPKFASSLPVGAVSFLNL